MCSSGKPEKLLFGSISKPAAIIWNQRPLMLYNPVILGDFSLQKTLQSCKIPISREQLRQSLAMIE
jgi:hypothetical protein